MLWGAAPLWGYSLSGEHLVQCGGRPAGSPEEPAPQLLGAQALGLGQGRLLLSQSLEGGWDSTGDLALGCDGGAQCLPRQLSESSKD